MEHAETLKVELANISGSIRDLRQGLRYELTAFKGKLESGMKQEIAISRKDIEQRLIENR